MQRNAPFAPLWSSDLAKRSQDEKLIIWGWNWQFTFSTYHTASCQVWTWLKLWKIHVALSQMRMNTLFLIWIFIVLCLHDSCVSSLVQFWEVCVFLNKQIRVCISCFCWWPDFTKMSWHEKTWQLCHTDWCTFTFAKLKVDEDRPQIPTQWPRCLNVQARQSLRKQP